MTKFFYKAKNGPTQIVDGFIEAQTKTVAIREIVAMGLTPLDIVQAATGEKPLTLRARSKPAPAVLKNLRLSLPSPRSVSPREIVSFTRQLCDLVEASVPLLRVLQIVSRQTRQPYFKSVIEQMYLFVQNGGSLSGAMARHPDIFPMFYVNMVKTGEAGGQLDKVLQRLGGHPGKENRK